MSDEVLYQAKRFKLVARPDFSRKHTEGLKLPTREVVVHPGSVVILALTKDREVVLIQNQRVSVRQTLLELPAGTLTPNEAPLDCAQRELLEETGYKAQHWKELFSFYACPGISDEQMFVFFADGLTAHEQQLEDDEQISVVLHSVQDALNLIKAAKIRDGKTIATLLYWERFQHE